MKIIEATTSVTHTQSTSTQQQMTQESSLETAVERVEKAAFIERFLTISNETGRYTRETEATRRAMAGDLWNRIFCISDTNSTLVKSSYPYRYLSKVSCDTVIYRCTEFGSGIDYRNLAQYFFPVQDVEDPKGLQTILHYQMNDEIRLSPWAVTCPDDESEKPDCEDPATFIDEDHKQFFQALLAQAYDTCSEKNLLEVSTRFYNKLQMQYSKIQTQSSREGEEVVKDMSILLKIFAKQFEKLQDEQSGYWYYNPVVWLSRVASILINPRLKDDNILFQIEEVSEMNLADPLGVIKTIYALHYHGIIPTYVTKHLESPTWGICTFLQPADNTWDIRPLSSFQPVEVKPSEYQWWPKEVVLQVSSKKISYTSSRETPVKSESDIALPKQEKDFAVFLYNYLSLQAHMPTMPVIRSLLTQIYNQYGYNAEDTQHSTMFRHGMVAQPIFLFALYKAVITCCTGQNYIPEQEPYYVDAIKKLLNDRDNYIVQLYDEIQEQPTHPLVDWVIIRRWSAQFSNSPIQTNIMGIINRLASDKTLVATSLFLSASRYLKLFSAELVTKDAPSKGNIVVDQASRIISQANNALKGAAVRSAMGSDVAEIATGGEETSDKDIEMLKNKIEKINELFVTSPLFKIFIQVGNKNIALEDTHSNKNSASEAANSSTIRLFPDEEKNTALTSVARMIATWNQWSDEPYPIATEQKIVLDVALKFLDNTTAEKIVELGFKKIPMPNEWASWTEEERVMDTRRAFVNGFRSYPFESTPNFFTPRNHDTFIQETNKKLANLRVFFHTLANHKFLVGVHEKFPRGDYQCVNSIDDPNWRTIQTQQSKINGVSQSKQEREEAENAFNFFELNDEQLTIGIDGKPTTRPKGLPARAPLPEIVSPERIQDMLILPTLSQRLDKLGAVKLYIAKHLGKITETSTLASLLQFLDHLIQNDLNHNTHPDRIAILSEMKTRFSHCFPTNYFDQAIEDENRADLTTIQQQRLKTIVGDDDEYDIIYPLLQQIHGYEKERNNTQCLNADFYDALLTELRIISQNSVQALRMTCKSIKYFTCSHQSARSICQHVIQRNSADKAQQVQTNAQEYLHYAPASREVTVILAHQEITHDNDMKAIIAQFSSPFVAEECIARLLLRGAQKTEIYGIMHSIAETRQQFPCTEHHLFSLAETAFTQGLHTNLPVLDRIATSLHEDPHATKRMFSILSYTQKCPALLTAFSTLYDSSEEPSQVVGYLDYLLRSTQDPRTAIETFTTLFTQHPQVVAPLITSPPYPSLETMQAIIRNELEADAFKKRPYERTTSHQFNQGDCDRLKGQFTGLAENLFEGTLWTEFVTSLETNRDKTPEALDKLRNGTDTERLAYIIEKLARTAHQSAGEGRVVSQELNTTQVMTLYAFIHESINDLPNVMAQISTGEGKSRIAIAYLAWQVLAREHTVDLLTSNAALSERDFLAYSDFLTGLDIRSALINMASDDSEYIKSGGINYSDNHSLFLKRLMGEAAGHFCAEASSKTTLFADEADTLYTDGRVHPYQIGKADDHSLLLPQLYKMVFEYYTFRGEASTVIGLQRHLAASVTGLTPAVKALIKGVKTRKLESLLRACEQARRMTRGDQYVISNEKQIVQTKAGLTRQHAILAMKKGRIQYGVIYEKGLHAFLALKEMQNGQGNIYIQPETTTTNNAFLVNILQHYNQTFGITGTTDLERFADLALHDTYFIKIPELRPNQRVINRPIWTGTLVDQLREVQYLVAEYPNSPILIFTKDDQALDLFAKLLQTAYPERKLNAIGAHASTEQEVAAIEEAGHNNTITLSTAGRLGRGTDIKNPAGNLLVITTYSADPRTYIQNISRTARYGKTGEVIGVYNLADYQLKPSNQNLVNLEELQEQIAQDQALTNKASDIFGFVRRQLQQRVPEDSLSDYWQYTSQEANRYYDIIKRLQDIEALRAFITSLETEVAETLQISYQNHDPIQVTQQIKDAFYSMEEFRHVADRARTTVEQTATHYQRGDDGQKITYASRSAWWEKIQATWRGKRRPFADLIAWSKGTGHAFPHGIPAWLITLWVVIPVAALIATAYIWQPVWTMAIALQALAWAKGTALPMTMHFFSTPIGLGIAGLVAFVALTLVIAYKYQQKTVKVNRFEQDLVTAKQLELNGIGHTSANTPVSDDLNKKSKFSPK